MPVPYSDNLYSAVSSDNEQDADALSPTDGYFHASSSSNVASPSPHQRTSSNVPRVPNVLVEDPSLQGNAKAREAEEERLNSEGNASMPQPTHHHRRSVEESLPAHNHQHQHTSSTSSVPLAPSVSDERSHLFHQQQVDAPPAYTPSPSSAPTGYQTFAPSPSTMGLPEEQQRLLPRNPESMGGVPTTSEPSRWQKLKDAVASLNLRRKVKTILGVLVILSIFAMIFSSFSLRSNHRQVCHISTWITRTSI